MEKRKIQTKPSCSLIRWRLAAIVSAAIFLLSCWFLLDTLLTITQSSDGIRVTVPDFRGMREEQIELADWMETESEYRYAEGIKEGVVIAQIPAAGTQRKLSAQQPICRIKLIVSLGPAPRENED